MKLIKSTKIIFFILGMFFVGMAIISADTGTGSTTITVGPASVATPDLTVTIHYAYTNVDNVNGPVTTTVDGPFTLNWGAVANADSCTLEGGNALTGGGSYSGTSNGWSNYTHDFTLTCSGPNSSSASDTVNISYPPQPTGFGFSCNADSTVATIHWDPTGYNGNTFYTRAVVNDTGAYVLSQDDYVGTSTAFNVSPNTYYWSWVHSEASNGSYGSGAGATVYCERVNGGWSGWSPKDNSCGYSGTQTRSCNSPSPSGGGADCSGLDGGNSTQSYSNTVCPPAAPTGFGAAPSSCNNNWLNLWWNSSPGATNYKVYRNGGLVYNDSGTSFSDSGLSLNGSYSYTITASNAGGTSGVASTSATVAPNCPINASCGSSNGGNFYSSPTSGYCVDGSSPTISGSGPWTWTCSGSYGGSNASCSANKAVDGGWSAWSGQDNSCGYYAVDRTETRTCTNPSPAYGGNDCSGLDGGNSSRTYHVNACAPTINSVSVLPDPVPYGSSTNVTFTTTNGYYCLAMEDWNSSPYFYQNYTGGTTISTPIQNTPGGHSVQVLCYNSDWTSHNGYWYNVNFSVKEKPVDGYWTDWSARDNSCGFYTQTKTQTRSCVGPYYGGADCSGLDGGNSTQTYTIPACLASINSVSVSPNPVPYGSSTTISYSANSNTNFCYILMDWNWSYYNGTYATSGSYVTPPMTSPGGHTASALCYNTDGIDTGWYSVGFTVNPAPTGTLSASNCLISEGLSSCNSSLLWETFYPLGTSAVTTPGDTVANSNSGSTTYPVAYGSRNFFLYNNGSQLASATATASCSQSPVATAWYDGACRRAINGGWTGWSGQDNSCGYYAVDRTQTRTCTNPSPAYGGADCSGLDGGNSTKTYHVNACVPTINSVSISPNPVPYGGTTNVSFSTTNGYYCIVMQDWGPYIWEGYTSGTTITTGVMTASGDHSMQVLCYNSDWTNHNGYWYNVGFSVARNGGWSEWSAQDNSCSGFSAADRTQTRTCTNPSPAWGGNDCSGLDGGNSSRTYHVNACASNITSLYVSPNVVPYGSAANIYYSCSNGYYSHIILDDSWAWQDSNYYSSRAPTSTGAMTVPGSHYAMAYCYNSDMVPSANSWSRIGTFTVNPPPSGSLSASDCAIGAGASSCNSSLLWETFYPLGNSSVTTPGDTVSNSNSGSTTYPVYYGTRNFYLYNNSSLLDSKTATASCVAGTGWYDGACRYPINGGWSGWSARDNSCAFTAQTRTQTRSCTNPSPAYGGADCSGLDGGNSTQTYTIPACLASINSVSVSPNPVPYGSSTTISYSANSNTNFCYILMDWNWSYYNGTYATSGSYVTPPMTSPGGHTASALCYNTDGIDTGWYSVGFTVKEKPIDGGWTAWSARDESCAFTAQTRTQTRSCTNPSPAYGGADCSSLDGGNSTQTYTITACASNITSLYVSPNVVPYGSAANIYYSCSNGYYSHIILDDSWAWQDSNYYSSRTPTSTGAMTVPGSHYAMAYCYNTDWIPSANSWSRIGTFTVSNAPLPIPDLKVTAWGSNNADGSIETYTGSPYTLSWDAVANATSCTINGGGVSASGGTQSGTANTRSQTFTLNCTNITGQSASDSVTITTPPDPTGVTYSCSADAMTVTATWNTSYGYNTFYTRTSSGYNNDGVVGTSYSFPVSPNTDYSFWVHTRTPSNGAWSNPIYASPRCNRTHTLTVNSTGTGTGSVGGGGTYNYNVTATATATPDISSTFTGWSGDCNASGQVVMNSNKVCTANFTLKTYTLTINKSGTGAGTVTGAGTYNYGTVVTSTASPSTGSIFVGWSGEGCSGTGNCMVTINSAKNITATFTQVTVGVTASPTSYSTTPSTNVSFTYTPTTNVGATECRLLDNASGALTGYQANSPLIYATPSTYGSFGYYVQCRNTVHTTVTATSSLITVSAITISVLPTTSYNVLPGAVVPFAYTASSNPAGSGVTECYLLNNVLAPVTAFQLSSPISYAIPNNIGSYGYYVKCRNTTTTTAIATSVLITVNTACANGLPGTSWNGTACVAPTGWITADNCNIESGHSNCPTRLDWNTTYPFTTSAVTTPDSITIASANSGINIPYTVEYGSRNFYLYNNGNLLSQAGATASCTSGTVWSDESHVCEPPTGTITSSGCTIVLNDSTCLVNLIWDTKNPLKNPPMTSVVKNITNNITQATGNSNNSVVSGSNTYTFTSPGSKTFELWHNGLLLKNTDTPPVEASISPVAVCVNNTHWSGSKCIIDALVADVNTTFTAEPATIFEGRSSVLTWNSPLADSCTVKNKADPSVVLSTGKSGVKTVSPIITTTYVLTCSNETTSNLTIERTVKVIVMTVKEQ